MNVSVPESAITAGPHVTWKHIDGPLMSWASHLHWLTYRERLRIFFRLATVDRIACERWPHLAKARDEIFRRWRVPRLRRAG